MQGDNYMNKDDILVIRYPFLMKNSQADQLYMSILKQKENGVIILPDYCEVVTAPKDVEIKTEQPKNDHGIERMTFGSR
jgi:hypothetical protein